jgi:hypothetical protein
MIDESSYSEYLRTHTVTMVPFTPSLPLNHTPPPLASRRAVESSLTRANLVEGLTHIMLAHRSEQARGRAQDALAHTHTQHDWQHVCVCVCVHAAPRNCILLHLHSLRSQSVGDMREHCCPPCCPHTAKPSRLKGKSKREHDGVNQI